MEARARSVIHSRTAPGFAPSVVYVTISQPRGFSGVRGAAKTAEYTSDPQGHAGGVWGVNRFCREDDRK
jgi:hypothetical protein